MAETTRSQMPLLLPIVGGTGLHNFGYLPVVRSDMGVNLVPPHAAVRGSLALEGKNPYDSQVMSVGGFGSQIFHPGTFEIYRLMACQPTIALCKATVFGPILAVGWSIKKSKDAKDEVVQLIEKVFNPIRISLLCSMLKALEYGFKTHEVVWGPGEGELSKYVIPTKIKSLRNDWTFFRIDKNGNVLGVDNQGKFVPKDRLLTYTYDGEDGNPYGRSRNENCRRTWCNYLAKEDQLFKLEGKASGIITKVGYPPDVTETAEGDRMFDKAVQVAKDITNGRSVVYPSLAGVDVEDIGEAAEAAKNSLFNIELLQMGDTGTAQQSLINSLMYLDKLLCRGWLRSERSAIEAQGGGTRAESSDHTANISDTDCDHINGEIIQAINDQLVDKLVEENFGEKAVGSVRLIANEMVDEHMVVDMKLLDGALRDGTTLYEFFARVDWEAYFQRNSIPLRKKAPPFDDIMTPEEKQQSEMEAKQMEAEQAGLNGSKDLKTDGDKNDSENDKSKKPDPTKSDNTQYEKRRAVDKSKAV